MAAVLTPSPSPVTSTVGEEPLDCEEDKRFWLERGDNQYFELIASHRANDKARQTPRPLLPRDEVLKLPGKHNFMTWPIDEPPPPTGSPPTPQSLSPPTPVVVPVPVPPVINEIIAERDRKTEGAADEMRRHSEDSLHRDDLANVDLTKSDNQLAVEAILRARLVKQPIHPQYAGWPHLKKLEERTRKISAATGTEPNSGQGLLGKKYWCSHWVRRKECDFIQQGCMYLHWIPAQDILTGLGFQDYPQWYKDMTAEEQKVYTPSWNHGGIPPDFEKAAPKRHSRKRDHSDFSSDSPVNRQNGRTARRSLHRKPGNHREHTRFSPPKRNPRDQHISPARGHPPGPARGGAHARQSRPMGPPPAPNPANISRIWYENPNKPLTFAPNPLAKTYRPEDYPPRFPGNEEPSIAATSAPPTPLMSPQSLHKTPVHLPGEPVHHDFYGALVSAPNTPFGLDESSPKRRRGDDYKSDRCNSITSITSSVMAHEAAQASLAYPPLVPERNGVPHPPPTPSSIFSEQQRFYTPFENRSQNHGSMSRPRSISPSADLSSSVPDLGNPGTNRFGVIGDQRPKAFVAIETLEDGEILSKPSANKTKEFYEPDDEELLMTFDYM